MVKPDDLSKPPVAFDHDSTLVVVLEMSGRSWLAAAIVPGVDRRPLQKLPVDEHRLYQLLERWQGEARQHGKAISRVVLAHEAGRDGFWLARWLRTRGVEVCVIHPTSIAVSREARRAKTDRLDTGMLMRALLGWLRAEPDCCRMVAIPSAAEEDLRRPGREREQLVGERTRVTNRIKSAMARLGIRGFKPGLARAAERLAELRTAEDDPIPPQTQRELERALDRLWLIKDQIAAIEADREAALAAAPADGANAMIRLLARVRGIGVETAEMLVREVLSRGLRDRRALARFAGLTGTPDESGARRRQKGIARAGHRRVRGGMIQLAWRLLQFQGGSELAQWYLRRVAGAGGVGRKTFIVALARKLLIALWRFATAGEIPRGFVLRPTAA
ncbi:MAG: transposase [Geminicoccaceae bacterium]|jgi:transposase|nr:transposase [Geminicoccaceae bacterium]